ATRAMPRPLRAELRDVRCLFLLPLTPPARRYPLSLHDALPISATRTRITRCALLSYVREGTVELWSRAVVQQSPRAHRRGVHSRSEEHTSELQSRGHIVCRLLLEKKKTAL